MSTLYFDTMASSIIEPEVLEAMQDIYLNHPGNPSSEHSISLQKKISIAEHCIRNVVNGENYNVVWTSGATEAINLAIIGAAHSYQRQGKHLITFKTEHQATLAAYNRLNELGFITCILPVKKDGLIDQAKLMANITQDTIMVSICHVNNEIGTIQDINKLVNAIQKVGCLVHIDAAQTIGKAQLDLQLAPADFVSLSAHKFHGPQGIGALLIKNKRQLQPIMFGGNQQNIRPGTMPAALIVGMGHAAKLANKSSNIAKWQRKIIAMLNKLGQITIHGCMQNRVPHNLNICVKGVNAEALKSLLKDIAISSGSACHAQSPQPSHVLLALDYPFEHAAHSLRISLGRHLSEQDINHFCHQFSSAVIHLRELSGFLRTKTNYRHSYSAVKIPEIYFVTWYIKDEHVKFDVMGPPILIEATCLLAKKANLNLRQDHLETIISELDVPENLRHHVEFSNQALTRLMNKLLD